MHTYSKPQHTDEQRAEFIKAYFISKLGAGVVETSVVQQAQDYISALTDKQRITMLAELRNAPEGNSIRTKRALLDTKTLFHDALVKTKEERLPESSINTAIREYSEYLTYCEVIQRGREFLEPKSLIEVELKRKSSAGTLLIDFCESIDQLRAAKFDVSKQAELESIQTYYKGKHVAAGAAAKSHATQYLRDAVNACDDNDKKLEFLAANSSLVSVDGEYTDHLVSDRAAINTPANFQEMLRRQADEATKSGLVIRG